MTPADAFAQFKDLKDLTQASDAEVKAMLIYGCKQAPLTNFEDVMTEQLVRLFRHVTGVTWIRGWEQGARPGSQYGTIWMYGSKTIGQPTLEYQQVVDGATLEVQDDLCEVVYQTFEFQFQLDSYRDSGVANRDQLEGQQTAPGLSAVDVLHRLIATFGHPRFRAALRESCIQPGAPLFGAVRNLAKPLVQNTFESRANVDFFVRAQVMSSLRTPTFADVDWGFVCPTDEQLYPEPPANPIC